MKHPIYAAYAAATCLFLFFANMRGWTLFPPSNPSAAAAGATHGGVGFHK